ncbi:hypothetical protein RDABS01_012154 [Bienertia sinuspersici]
MVSVGLTGNNIIFEKMLKSYVANERLDEAKELIRKARDMGFQLKTDSGSCAFEFVSENHDTNAAYELFKEIRAQGLLPSSTSFTHLIKVCVQQKKLEQALRVKDEMISCGIPMTINVATTLMKGYCELGLLDAQSWEKACEHLSRAEETGTIRTYSFHLMMSLLCEEGKVDLARQLWDKILESGSIPSVVYVNFRLSKEKTVTLTNDVDYKGYKPSAVIYTALMDGYFKNGEVEKALKVFDEMVIKGVNCKALAYNTVISGLCQNGQTSQAKKVLEKFIVEANFKPSFTTYNFLIDGFTKECDTESASSFSTEMSNKGFSADVVFGKICEAKRYENVLQMLRAKVEEGFVLDVMTFEKLISSYCLNGSMAIAWKLYSELLHEGLPPSQSILHSMIEGLQLVEERRIP